MRTASRRNIGRLATAFLIGVGTLGGAAVVPAPALAAPVDPAHAYVNRLVSRLSGAPTTRPRSASAPEASVPSVGVATATTTCADASTPPVQVACPTIVGLSVGSAWIRKSTTPSITYPVTVVVDDPANIALVTVTGMGRQLDRAQPTTGAVLVGVGAGELARVPGSTTKKTVTLTVESPYLPFASFSDDTPPPAYGGFQIDTVVFGNAPDGPPLVQIWRSGSIRAQSAVTNTPSATSVRKGQLFTERGKLTRFDGTPQAGQKVNVYYVPAGQTKASYAGSATTSWTGAWTLPVRSWFTGSWFASYPGSDFSTSVYKGAWVRVS